MLSCLPSPSPSAPPRWSATAARRARRACPAPPGVGGAPAVRRLARALPPSPAPAPAAPSPGLASLRRLRSCVDAQQFDRPMLEALFEVAARCEGVRRGSPESRALEGYLMATLFYEPSTRTRLSFEAAMRRLGGSVLTTESAGEFSSAAKGETLEDTVRTVEAYADVIVLRHFAAGSAARAAAAVPSTPLINAGDGPGQHPTQALLDVYTIRKELGRLDGLVVALVGDLANGRTARSLAYLLAKFEGVRLIFVAPAVVRMGDDIKAHLTAVGTAWSESDDLMAAAGQCDVLYQTRIQKERFGLGREADYEAARGRYVVTPDVMRALPAHGVVMHPLPRLDEITVECDADPRAAYFRQAQNGLFIRMALLKVMLLADGG